MRSEWQSLFSPAVMIPVQADQPYGQRGRLMIDWRGIPLASPIAFDRVPPNSRMPIARRWEERPNFFLKLVHPDLGTTVDYAVRCLFNPNIHGPDWADEGNVHLVCTRCVNPLDKRGGFCPRCGNVV